MLPTGAIFELKAQQNAFADPTGEDCSAPQTLTGFQGAASPQGRGGEKKREDGMGRREGKGIGEEGAFHTFSFKI